MSSICAFHGVDHKVGVTMIAQSVAESIATCRPDIDVLFISLNGRKSAEYVRESVRCIDEFKPQIDSKMIVPTELVQKCRHKGNLHILAGVKQEEEGRYYFPEGIKYLISSLKPLFPIIIADTGSELDSGLAIGGLLCSSENYLVLTQQETSLDRFDKKRRVLETAKIDFPFLVVNKHMDNDPHSMGYMERRTEYEKSNLFKVAMTGYDRDAELHRCSLLEFKSGGYRNDIALIANHILGNAGIPEGESRGGKKKWRGLI